MFAPTLRSLLRCSRRGRSRHRGVRRRSLRVTLAVIIVGTGTLASIDTPPATATTPAVRVPSSVCARYDSNLVSGVCLQYQSRSGTAYTWIGTYRASGGGTFFCIDYLYDSRISAGAARVSTIGLRNQLNRPIGTWEVAALNYLISTHAPSGTTGSAVGNAALALIIREVMGDGIRNDGTVVYQPGLKVGGTVKSVPGGMPNEILGQAQRWWSEASRLRGPWTVKMAPRTATHEVPLGAAVSYAVQVTSASGAVVTGTTVTFTCTGPIACPSAMVTGAQPKSVTLKPSALGTYTIVATANGPAGQGQLLQGSWSAHGGTTAKNAGVQRGWITQRVSAKVAASGSAKIVKAVPKVVTKAQASAAPGGTLTDLVTVAGLPPSYNHPMTATLYGPFDSAPMASSCTQDTIAGTVTMPLTKNGSFRTPGIKVTEAGYYVWTETLPGDATTNPVQTACGIAEETTLVRTSPRIATVLSSQRATEGALLRDTIEVSGTSGSSLDVGWELVGPMAPVEGRCSGVEWTQAPVAATGTIVAEGDGRYVTPPSQVSRAGCYTFAEAIPGTPVSGPAATRRGEPAETTIVRDRPQFHTVASARRLEAPGAISDTITVNSVTHGSIRIIWELLGPIAPGVSGCSGLDWRQAPVRATGEVSSGAGSVRTAPVRVTTAGCYTFREHSRATPTAAEANSPAGLPEETALITRKPLRLVPEVPTGPAISLLPFSGAAWLARLSVL